MGNRTILEVAAAMILLAARVHAQWDDGLLKRVGTADSKTFYTSPWAYNLTWVQAQEFCNQVKPGMHLATVETDRERSVVYGFFVGNAGKYPEFWLSATDYGTEGSFYATRTGNEIPFPVKQESGDDGKQENCLKIVQNGAGSFEDEVCTGWTSNKIWPLCEISTDETTKPPPTTVAPTTVAPTTQALTTTTTSPPSPVFECTSEGYHADPLTCDVFHVCVSYQGDYLDYEFNCPLFTQYCSNGNYCGWPADCPCELQRTGVRSESKPYFEKFPIEVVATVGSKTFYTDTKSRNLNWIEAMEFCHQNDMIMARVETNEERSYLVIALKANYYIDMFWLSAMDYGSEGSYYWMNSGEKLEWAPYGNGGRDSNCLYLYDTGPVYDWSCDSHTNQKLYPLCQLVTEP